MKRRVDPDLAAALRERIGADGLLTVRVTPGARANVVMPAADDGVVQVRVTARAVDGAANGAVLRVLAGTLGLAPRRLSLRRGERSRDKRIAVDL